MDEEFVWVKEDLEGTLVVKRGPAFYKFFLPHSTEKERHIQDFHREVFLTKLVKEHTKNPEQMPNYLMHFENFRDYSVRKNTLAKLSKYGSHQVALQNERVEIPCMVTYASSGIPLNEWLEKRKTPIPMETIRKVAFQLTWLLDELHTTFGIQHNDIQEHNIMVQEMTKKSTNAYEILSREPDTPPDLFLLQLEPGDLFISLLDFGASQIIPLKPFKVWSQPSGVALQSNQPPEFYFIPGTPKNSEGDIYMMGLVLLTLVAHQRWEKYAYKGYANPHTYDVTDKKAVALGFTGSLDIVAGIKDPSRFGPEEVYEGLLPWDDPLFKGKKNANINAVDNKRKRIAELFLLNLFALDYTFHGEKNHPSSYYKDFGPEAKVFIDMMISTPEYDASKYDTYRKEHFASLLTEAKKLGIDAFLGRCLFFNREDRARFAMPYEPWGLTSALFDAYFAPFYLGPQNQNIRKLGQILSFSPPLEYSQYNPDAADIQEKLALLTREEDAFIASIPEPIPPNVILPPEAMQPEPRQDDEEDDGTEEAEQAPAAPAPAAPQEAAPAPAAPAPAARPEAAEPEAEPRPEELLSPPSSPSSFKEAPDLREKNDNQLKKNISLAIGSILPFFSPDKPIPRTITDSAVQKWFLSPMREFAEMVDQEFSPAQYQRLSEVWKGNSYGWSSVVNPQNGRLYAQHSFTRVNLKNVPVSSNITPKNEGTLYNDRQERNKGYPIIKHDNYPETIQIYRDLVGHLAFMATAYLVVAQDEAKLASLRERIADLDEYTDAENFQVFIGPRTNEAGRAEIYANAKEKAELLLAAFYIQEKTEQKSRVQIGLANIQRTLEIIETLEEYSDETGTGYNRPLIYHDLIVPLQEHVAEHQEEHDEEMRGIFDSLGLGQSALSVKPQLETRYYHMLSLAVQLLMGGTEEASTDELVERIGIEWPKDLVSGE